MTITSTTIARRLVLTAVAVGVLAAAPAQAAESTPRPLGEIVVPQQILDLAPAGTPVRDAATLPRVRWTTMKIHANTRSRRSPSRCRGRHGAALRRCVRSSSAHAAGDYGLHFLSPDAVCSSQGVTFDYRSFWVSSMSGGIELMMVQDYAFYWDGRTWKQYSQDQVAYAWSGYQLQTGWSTPGPNGTVLSVSLGDGVRFGTARGAKIKIVQGIAWLDGRGNVISTTYRALGHTNPGWFDFASHPFCQY